MPSSTSRKAWRRQWYRRGHPIVSDDGRQWRWAATGRFLRLGSDPSDPPCAACGEPPTPEGYDACLGYIPGAISACCGHGVHAGHVTYTRGDAQPLPPEWEDGRS